MPKERSPTYSRGVLQSMLNDCRFIAEKYERRSTLAFRKVRQYLHKHQSSLRSKDKRNLVNQIGIHRPNHKY